MSQSNDRSWVDKLFQWPRIPLGLRLFLLYVVVVALTTYVVSSTVMREIKPTVRQVSEETLVDMANLLATLAAPHLQQGTLSSSEFAELLSHFGQRDPNAAIWGVDKSSINHRIYITDANGIVQVDSWQRDVGADFSRWNDVYLTLRGEYGARSSIQEGEDPTSTVMHVAAPIRADGEIIGSVTVAKANRSVQPFIDKAKYRVLTWLVVMSVVALLLGALIAWRINTALDKLANYAAKLGRGEKARQPVFRIFYEYGQLSEALAAMRAKLDGKNYVEQYVQTLTHELKSPLSAIKGASELLQTPLTEQKQRLFASNIEKESERMQQLIDNLLALARLEKQPQLQSKRAIELAPLINRVCESMLATITQKRVQMQVNCDPGQSLLGDAFLVQQALYNLLENALDFVVVGGEVSVSVQTEPDRTLIQVFNQGPAIPDYALSKVCERFYSLPRDNGHKSSGLGLTFVEQIMQLHQGKLLIANESDGVRVTLIFTTP
ncbi:two-component system sensor histidine kinase CreC [Pseudoalteromonas sp. T1lg22]|uniref:two-component system sensor histidine kinase CreC n=1 Tax=Pseudoalteromonas sp. T1lg22 TaxID=2077096 RepID=UPI0018F864EC|nr:two-component system sensor histidine kinase CreC [Pseudoalteromonas sp. T1lg22]